MFVFHCPQTLLAEALSAYSVSLIDFWMVLDLVFPKDRRSRGLTKELLVDILAWDSFQQVLKEPHWR